MIKIQNPLISFYWRVESVVTVLKGVGVTIRIWQKEKRINRLVESCHNWIFYRHYWSKEEGINSPGKSRL